VDVRGPSLLVPGLAQRRRPMGSIRPGEHATQGGYVADEGRIDVRAIAYARFGPPEVLEPTGATSSSLPDGPFKRSRRSAHLDGFSLHAGVRVHENDREGLERLFRYAFRPPLALNRLSQGPDGRLVYRMKRPQGGSLFLLLTPDELLARLATLVPPPRSHALRYHGLFAPNPRHRARAVPAGITGGRAAPCASSVGPEPEPPGVTPASDDSRADGPPGFRLEALDPPPDRPFPRTSESGHLF